MNEGSCVEWAESEFGQASLGDVRRTARLVAMAASVADRPAGRVSEVFRTDAERQGAYDFLESPHVDEVALAEAAIEACVERAAEFPFVFVPVDGTSINLTDRKKSKDFGSVGSRERGARGLKVVSAIAVDPAGMPLGLMAMEWWARGPKSPRGKDHRETSEKETQHWLDALRAASTSLRERGVRAWFQIDREGDAQDILEQLADDGHWFTVRSRSSRRLRTHRTILGRPHTDPEKRRRYLHAYLDRRPPMALDLLEVPAQDGCPARLACVALRVASIELFLAHKYTNRYRALSLNVVSVREHGRSMSRPSRSGKSRGRQLEWVLLTNRPVDTVEQVREVVFGYTQRWRIEDFHRSWKTGVCNVEDSQLHARAHVIKWATVLAAVALRAERIKHLSREHPDRPASEELSDAEVKALILLKRRYKKRTETISDEMPTLATATRWIAELGGYTGKSSGGPPGTITITRGLEQLRVAAEVIEALRASEKKR